MIKFLKIFLFFFTFLIFGIKIFSQNKIINLKEVIIQTNKKDVFKKTDLYDINDSIDEPNIEGFYALNIFNETISNEIWFTTNKNCINVNIEKENAFKGKTSLHIKWDKISGGCNWIGMGFGWNDWQGKDLTSITGKAAIQLYVKTKGDTLKSLPLALALEDYSGVQAYTGFSPSFIEGGKITSNWTKVTIPFSVFPIVQTDLDISKIKQFIIQFEADGDLIFDEITVVPFEGILKPKFTASMLTKEIIIDGQLNSEEWGISPILINDLNKIFIKYDQNNIFIAANIVESNPLINKFDDSEIWNGDAIELSIGTNSEADLSRTRYLLSDFQIGIKCAQDAYVWNWKNKSRINNAEIKTLKTNDGYSIEVKIPLISFGDFRLENGKKYGFEIAIDDADQSGKRIKQIRWASPHQEGFNLNPSLWGLMYVN